MRHLGPRVAPLVDGRMAPAEEERAWVHVHGCSLCSEAVQREGWVKRRLAGLSYAGSEPVPDELRGTLRNPLVFASYPGYADLAEDDDAPGGDGRARRVAGLAFLGAGSVSAAMMGVVAFGVAPANAPGLERLPASITQPSAAPSASTKARDRRALRDSAEVGVLARRVAVTVGAAVSFGR